MCRCGWSSRSAVDLRCVRSCSGIVPTHPLPRPRETHQGRRPQCGRRALGRRRRPARSGAPDQAVPTCRQQQTHTAARDQIRTCATNRSIRPKLFARSAEMRHEPATSIQTTRRRLRRLRTIVQCGCKSLDHQASRRARTGQEAKHRLSNHTRLQRVNVFSARPKRHRQSTDYWDLSQESNKASSSPSRCKRCYLSRAAMGQSDYTISM